MTERQFHKELRRLARRNYGDACVERAHRYSLYQRAAADPRTERDDLLRLADAYDEARLAVERLDKERLAADDALAAIDEEMTSRATR